MVPLPLPQTPWWPAHQPWSAEKTTSVVGGGEAAGHPGHAAGRADGGGGEGAGEAGAATGEAVDVVREGAAGAVRAGGPGAVIVGHEEDHVGMRGGALAGLHEGRSHPGQKERAAVDWHRDSW